MLWWYSTGMNNKSWVVALFAIAAIAYFFPGWNGFFFDPSDIGVGDSRIMASILFVGGLLLWYLTPRKD